VTDGIRAQPYKPGKPPLSATDVWISIAALTVTLVIGVVAAVGGMFSLAFLDSCPPESCSANGAATAVLGSLLIAGLAGIAGLIVTVVQIVRRKRGWPFAIATLAACAVVLFAGVIGYMVATGMAGASSR
jgi:hypothetical protein